MKELDIGSGSCTFMYICKKNKNFLPWLCFKFFGFDNNKKIIENNSVSQLIVIQKLLETIRSKLKGSKYKKVDSIPKAASIFTNGHGKIAKSKCMGIIVF